MKMQILGHCGRVGGDEAGQAAQNQIGRAKKYQAFAAAGDVKQLYV